MDARFLFAQVNGLTQSILKGVIAYVLPYVHGLVVL